MLELECVAKEEAREKGTTGEGKKNPPKKLHGEAVSRRLPRLQRAPPHVGERRPQNQKVFTERGMLSADKQICEERKTQTRQSAVGIFLKE